MSTPHGPERRTQALRRSGAAGIHDQRPTRSESERAAVADQDGRRNPALDDYLGQWVAVADGEVVAAAPTSGALVPPVKALADEVQRRAVVQYAHAPGDPLFIGAWS